MTAKKQKTKSVVEEVYHEPEQEFQEVEQTPIVEASVEMPQQENVTVEQPKQGATFLVKKVRLVRDIGSLKAGTVIDITRCENRKLYFKFGNAEAYFDSSENNVLYSVVE